MEEQIVYSKEAIVSTDIEPMILRPFPEICKESAKNFKLKDKYAKIKNRGKALGVKRKIFTDVLDSICAVSTTLSKHCSIYPTCLSIPQKIS